MDYVIYFATGFLGGLIHEVVDDNRLKLPKIENGEVMLGFLGSAVIGGVVGIIADNNPINALLAGYVGISVITNLTPKLKVVPVQ